MFNFSMVSHHMDVFIFVDCIACVQIGLYHLMFGRHSQTTCLKSASDFHQLFFVVEFINILNILLVALNLNLNVCSGDMCLIRRINCIQTTYEAVIMPITWPGILILVEYFVWSALDICHEQLTRIIDN